jgi:hypothetical protein
VAHRGDYVSRFSEQSTDWIEIVRATDPPS